MKKIIITSLVASFFVLFSCKPSANDAVDYNDAITKIFNNLTIYQNLFVDQLDAHNLDSLKISLKLLTSNTEASLMGAEKIEDFDGNTEFIDVDKNYFRKMNGIVGNGKQIVDVYSKYENDTIEISTEDYDKISALATTYDEVYNKYYDEFIAAQIKFAKTWKFELDPNKELN